jgi:hypothetical protein
MASSAPAARGQVVLVAEAARPGLSVNSQTDPYPLLQTSSEISFCQIPCARARTHTHTHTHTHTPTHVRSKQEITEDSCLHHFSRDTVVKLQEPS